MDWNDLRYVLTIQREGTLVAAARTLGVAHTTVGRRLKTLEARLGVRLFDRTPDGLVPTGAGEEVIAVAEEMEGQVLAMEGRVMGRDAQLRGELRVSTTASLYASFTDAFTSFTARFPEVDLTLFITDDTINLARREADVVLRSSNAPDDVLFGRKVGTIQFAAYASEALVRELGEEASLEAYPWIGWDRRHEWGWFDDWLRARAPEARIVLRMNNNFTAVAHAVRRGVGAQILPCFVADPDPALRRIAPLEELFQVGLWLLTLPELRTNSRVRALMTHLAEALVPQRALLAGSTSG